MANSVPKGAEPLGSKLYFFKSTTSSRDVLQVFCAEFNLARVDWMMRGDCAHTAAAASSTIAMIAVRFISAP